MVGTMTGEDLRDDRTLMVSGLASDVAKEELEEVFSGVGLVKHCVLVTEKGNKESRGYGFVSFSVPEDAKLALRELQGNSLKGQSIHIAFAKRRSRGYGDQTESAAKKSQKTNPPEYRKNGSTSTSRQTTPIVIVQDGPSVDQIKKLLKKSKGVEKVEEREGRTIITFDRFKHARKSIAQLHEISHEGGVSNAYFESETGRRERIIVRNLPFNVGEKEIKNVFKKHGPIRQVHMPKKATGKPAGFAFVEFFHGVDANGAVASVNGTKIGGRMVAVDIAVPKNKYDQLAHEPEAEQKHEFKGGRDQKGADVDGETDNLEDSEVDDDDDDSEEAQDDLEEVEDDEDIDQRNDDESENEVNDSDSDGLENTVDENESSSDEENEEQPTAKGKSSKTTSQPKSYESTADELERTTFVRNIRFETTSQELRSALSAYGAVQHCVVVKDKVTGRPRGSAFVRFATKHALERALEASGYDHKVGRQVRDEENPDHGISVGGRSLLLVPAVDRSSAKAFPSAADGLGGTMKKRQESSTDKRNLWLAHEGRIVAGDPAAKGLSEIDLSKRRQAEREKVKKLQNNPNVYVSKTRLSVRNLPLNVEAKLLKKIFAKASEISLDKIVQCKVVRDKERKDAAGLFRSKGYGFVEFKNHEHAMRALRMTNNNPKAFATYGGMDVQDRRMIVEFSLEDARKVRILKQRQERIGATPAATQKNREVGKTQEGINVAPHGDKNNSTAGSKRKRKVHRQNPETSDDRKPKEKPANVKRRKNSRRGLQQPRT